MKNSRSFKIFRDVYYRLWIILGAVAVSLALFLVLPLLQNITKPPATDLVLQNVDTGNVEPPPPPLEEKREQEVKDEEQPPELAEAVPQPLDLSQLELALNPGFSEGWIGGGDFAVNLNSLMATANASMGGSGLDAIFSELDLDEKPRVIYQPSPAVNAQMRRRAPGTVYILFIVDERGRVVEPRVQKATDPIFENPALKAVKQWKFEPGKRKGKAVRFRMRVPITFPKG